MSAQVLLPWDVRPDGPSEGGRFRSWPLAAAALFLGLVVVAGALFLRNAASSPTPWINHDVGYHAYLGAEMDRGQRLYVDLQEDNPPGSPLLLGTLLRIGRGLGLPDFAGLHLVVLLLGCCGLALLRRALPGPDDDLSFSLVALAYMLVLLRGTFSNSLYPAAPNLPYDFGQREHLFSLLFLPYLLLRLRARTISPMLYPWLIAVGYAALFKPYWPFMVALVELYRAFDRQRDWRPTLVLGVGMVLPFVALAVHSFDSLVTFFTENIPAFLRGAYAHYDTDFSAFAGSTLHLQMLIGALLLVLTAATAVVVGNLTWRAALLNLALAGLAYGSVLHQNKYWSYHTMTFFALTSVPTALCVSLAIERWAPRSRAVMIGALMTVCVGGAIVTTGGTVQMLRDYPPLGAYLTPLVEPHQRVVYFSTSVSTAYPPLLQRKPMIGRWTVHLHLPEILADPEPERRQRKLDNYIREVAQMLEDERPDLLLFSPERQTLPEGKTLHEIFHELGLLPVPGYRPMRRATLRRIAPRLGDGWKIYERSAGGEI